MSPGLFFSVVGDGSPLRVGADCCLTDWENGFNGGYGIRSIRSRNPLPVIRSPMRWIGLFSRQLALYITTKMRYDRYANMENGLGH